MYESEKRSQMTPQLVRRILNFKKAFQFFWEAIFSWNMTVRQYRASGDLRRRIRLRVWLLHREGNSKQQIHRKLNQH